LQELDLEATCFICQDGGLSMVRFVTSLGALQRVVLRSNMKAVRYDVMLASLKELKSSHWEPL
jgi:hypothetical protein